MKYFQFDVWSIFIAVYMKYLQMKLVFIIIIILTKIKFGWSERKYLCMRIFYQNKGVRKLNYHVPFCEGFECCCDIRTAIKVKSIQYFRVEIITKYIHFLVNNKKRCPSRAYKLYSLTQKAATFNFRFGKNRN